MTPEEKEHYGMLVGVLDEIHALLEPKKLKNLDVASLGAALLADSTFQLGAENGWSVEEMLTFGGQQFASSVGTIVREIDSAGEPQ